MITHQTKQPPRCSWMKQRILKSGNPLTKSTIPPTCHVGTNGFQDKKEEEKEGEFIKERFEINI